MRQRWFSTRIAEQWARTCSESDLLQELSEVGHLGELSVDPGQLVEHRTVQRHTQNLPLHTATTVPTDLDQWKTGVWLMKFNTNESLKLVLSTDLHQPVTYPCNITSITVLKIQF